MPNNRETLSNLISFVSERPTPDQVAQFLVLQTLKDFAPRAAMISVFFSDGSVHTAGSFGLSQDAIRGVHRRSLWDRDPAIDAIREGNPVIVNSSDVRSESPAENASILGSELPNIAWPLIVGNQRVGSLQIYFSDHFHTDSISEILDDISGVLGLYLTFQNLNHGTDYSQSRRSHHEPTNSLTPRQMKILKLLAQGLTNPQIAVRIGYSDSTVRQETMAVYRHLGVNGRRDAVDAATVRGILEPESQLSIQS